MIWIKKLIAVLLTVIASTVLVRLILDWVYHHGQSVFSVENIGFGLSAPLAFVFLERKHSVTKLVKISAAFATVFTVFDFVVVHYDLDWPGMTW